MSKRFANLLALLSFTTVTITTSGGCSSSPTFSKIKEEGREAIGQTREDWSERQQKFISRSETRLKDIQADLQRFDGKRSELPAPAEKKARDKISSLRSDVNDLTEDLNELKKTGPEDWQDERSDFMSKMNSVESEFESVRGMFK